MSGHEKKLKGFFKKPRKGDDVFDSAFERFVDIEELKRGIRASRPSNSERSRLQEKYIELLEQDIEWLQQEIGQLKAASPPSPEGRPSLRLEIQKAYHSLLSENKIRSGASKKSDRRLILERTMKTLNRDQGDKHGLSDDTIIRAIKAIPATN